MFKNINEYIDMFKNINEYIDMFKNVYSPMF